MLQLAAYVKSSWQHVTTTGRRAPQSAAPRSGPRHALHVYHQRLLPARVPPRHSREHQHLVGKQFKIHSVNNIKPRHKIPQLQLAPIQEIQRRQGGRR